MYPNIAEKIGIYVDFFNQIQLVIALYCQNIIFGIYFNIKRNFRFFQKFCTGISEQQNLNNSVGNSFVNHIFLEKFFKKIQGKGERNIHPHFTHRSHEKEIRFLGDNKLGISHKKRNFHCITKEKCAVLRLKIFGSKDYFFQNRMNLD